MGRPPDLNYRRRQHQRMTTRWIPALLLADCLNKKMEKCESWSMEQCSKAWQAWKRPFLLLPVVFGGVFFMTWHKQRRRAKSKRPPSQPTSHRYMY